MAYIKFSFVLFLILAMGKANSQVRFSPKSCLDSNYKMTMVQKGPLFGLLKHEFMINKTGCIIKISQRKYIPKEWVIDVCREPVHIKVSSATGIDVAKKTGECIQKDNTRDTSDFCSQYYDLMDVIQDDGLIFAEGDRDNLASDHGKTFCSYLLVKRYLNDSIVFSRYTDVPDIFIEKPSSVNPIQSTPSEESKDKKDQPVSSDPSNTAAKSN
jgi:hypothetical protein